MHEKKAIEDKLSSNVLKINELEKKNQDFAEKLSLKQQEIDNYFEA